MGSRRLSLSPGKRILYLTKDLDLVRRQLAGELSLTLAEIHPRDLLDDINTDVMAPGWVCFSWRPEEIARNAYAGLLDEHGERVFPEGALADGGFEAIVSGHRKGTGSSRETAVQAEKWSGIRFVFASSFAPIHAQNNTNQGQLMGNHELLRRFEAGEELEISEFTLGKDRATAAIIEAGGLFAYAAAFSRGDLQAPELETSPRALTMAEKILSRHVAGCAPEKSPPVKPGDALIARVDGGYSHEYTTAQVHAFLTEEFGEAYQLQDAKHFAVFEDHLIYADGVARMEPFAAKIEELREMQRAFQAHTGVQDFSARDGLSPGICHQIAREEFLLPGGFYLATDSHTCMGGASNALAYGVGATEYASLAYSGMAPVQVPESIRFELVGALRPGVTAKDLILQVLRTFAKQEQTLARVMEFGGPGLANLPVDERATLANMATECSARTALFEGDDRLAEWIASRHQLSPEVVRARFVFPDPGAHYDGGVHTLKLGNILPMVARPGDPTYGIQVEELDEVPIHIAYGGSCTAGKETDLDLYAQVMHEAHSVGRGVAPGVEFFIQFASQSVAEYAKAKGYLALFEATGVKIIPPGCGACIGCGPGVSTERSQVTISAVNRNFEGRSGPGNLYLASPLTVAASAVTGYIEAFRPGVFGT